MKKKSAFTLNVLALVLSIISLYIVMITPKNAIEANPYQYYGEIVSIKEEENQKIILVKGADTPYTQYDNDLEGKVELIVPEGTDISMRIGPSKQKPDLKLGEIGKMYEDLDVGDCIAFVFKDLVFENRKVIKEVIFTGN